MYQNRRLCFSKVLSRIPPQILYRLTPELRALRPGRSRSAERLAILLRLAVVLHRSRSPEPLPEFSVAVGKRSMSYARIDQLAIEHMLGAR